MERTEKLNHFTTLPILLSILSKKRLLLGDPEKWEDKNDSEILEAYRKHKGIPSIRALCFLSGSETIHHWKAYADGISGCCIEFDARKLKAVLGKIHSVRWGPVDYPLKKNVVSSFIEIDNIPFTKRRPYQFEKEFRVIWEGKGDPPEIRIGLGVIRRITLSPHLPKDLFTKIRDVLRDTFHVPEDRINHSTMYRNDDWISTFKNACSKKLSPTESAEAMRASRAPTIPHTP